MDVFRNYFFTYQALILSLLCLVKYRTVRSIFVDQPQCYRQAFSEEVVYFVNKSYINDTSIRYKQIICYPEERNWFCHLKFDENETTTCESSSANKTFGNLDHPSNAFSIHCHLIKYYNNVVVKSEAFKNDSLIGKSESKTVSLTETCNCNWSDILPTVNFLPRKVLLPTSEPISLKIDFKIASQFNMNVKYFLATNFSQKPICKGDFDRYISKNKTVVCTVDHLIGCNETSIVLKLRSRICEQENYEYFTSIPKILKNISISKGDFTCKTHNDDVVLVPLSRYEHYKYVIRNSTEIIQDGFIDTTEIKVGKTKEKQIQIKLCQLDCICSQYITLEICHSKYSPKKMSKLILVVILVSVALMLVISIAVFCIYRGRRQRKTSETIFDDSTVAMNGQSNAIQPTPWYSDVFWENADEKFDILGLDDDNLG